jgi:predicted nuclease of predicted toxin-antitoxin system
MRFLVDECTGSRVANWLREEGHQVFSVYDQARGISDDVIINKAFDENWILITNDKDFGEKVYRENRPHKGIIFLRLQDERSTNKINVLQRLLSRYHQRISDNFVVVTEKQVRFRTK